MACKLTNLSVKHIADIVSLSESPSSMWVKPGRFRKAGKKRFLYGILYDKLFI